MVHQKRIINDESFKYVYVTGLKNIILFNIMRENYHDSNHSTVERSTAGSEKVNGLHNFVLADQVTAKI